jgi:hypothetical protein
MKKSKQLAGRAALLCVVFAASGLLAGCALFGGGDGLPALDVGMEFVDDGGRVFSIVRTEDGSVDAQGELQDSRGNRYILGEGLLNFRVVNKTTGASVYIRPLQ